MLKKIKNENNKWEYKPKHKLQDTYEVEIKKPRLEIKDMELDKN